MTQPIELTEAEQMTCSALLAAYEAGRTQHTETHQIPGSLNPRTGKWQYEQVSVVTAECEREGVWRKLRQIGTDLNDETEPVFLDLEGAGRSVLTMSDVINVRGLQVV